MNILFLTLVWPENNEDNLYTDLMQEFIDANHTVFVVAVRERRVGKPTEYSMQNGMHILRVKCGNIQKTNPIEKGVSSAVLGYLMRAAIRRFYSNITFDLIISTTPPITLAGTIKVLKQKHRAKTYLLLKDIWPQGPADMGAIKKNGFVWHYFKQKEKQIYQVSDYIGCMSSANVQYVIKHNEDLDPEKVEECPNSVRPRNLVGTSCSKIRIKYGVPEEAIVFLFGGNIGKPQGVSFLVDVVDHIMDRKDIFFIIVGSGTEYSMIKTAIEQKYCSNILLLEKLPKDDYEEFCRACDVGLILLDNKFTIPNFPSRLLSYLDIGMPVLCATDDVCDMGDIVEEWECGIKTLHGDTDSFINAINKLASDKELRMAMSINARSLLEQKYTAKHSYDIIMSHFQGGK